jgi:integrase
LLSLERADSTIAGYQNDLNIFWCFLLQHCDNKPFTALLKRDVVAFQSYMLRENANSPARVRRIKATLSSLEKYIANICDDEYPKFRPIVNKVESPVNQAVRPKSVFTDRQLTQLLGVLSKGCQHIKACVLALAMYSGRRKSELMRFRVEDFTDDKLICNGAFYKTGPIRTKGRGRGKFIPAYVMAEEFRPYLQAWLWERERLDMADSEWLFPWPEDPTQHMNWRTIDSWAVTFSRILGTDFYWHAMRHYFTTRLARMGVTDAVIQHLVGWETAEMVRLYNDQGADEQLEQYFGAPGANPSPDLGGR